MRKAQVNAKKKNVQEYLKKSQTELLGKENNSH